MADLSRRLFLGGLLTVAAAPAIVRSGVLMPVRPMVEPVSGLSLLMKWQQDRNQFFRDAEANMLRHALAQGQGWLEHFSQQREIPRAMVMHDTRSIVFRRQALYGEWR